MEVRREDQEKINRFSSLHQKETALEEELRGKIVSLHMQLYADIWQLMYMQKEKEDLEEISTELELVDEEDKVPYVQRQPLLSSYTALRSS
jgi:prefoldin subunit 4